MYILIRVKCCVVVIQFHCCTWGTPLLLSVTYKSPVLVSHKWYSYTSGYVSELKARAKVGSIDSLSAKELMQMMMISTDNNGCLFKEKTFLNSRALNLTAIWTEFNWITITKGLEAQNGLCKKQHSSFYDPHCLLLNLILLFLWIETFHDGLGIHS